MATPAWRSRQGVWFNQNIIAVMRVQLDTVQSTWHIAYSFDGVNFTNDFQAFATQAAAQSALDTYATGLG